METEARGKNNNNIVFIIIRNWGRKRKRRIIEPKRDYNYTRKKKECAMIYEDSIADGGVIL